MKNLYLKKIATLTIAATLTMSVAACSSGNNGDKETTAAETTAEAETEAETEAVTEETTSSEITETTTEETTTETTVEEINDPDTSMYEDR